MDLEGVWLSEIRQTQREKYCIVSFYVEFFLKVRLIEVERRKVVARGWGCEK